MSILTVIQDAADEIGSITTPSAAVNSTDPNAKLLLALARRAGDSIYRRHDWTKLITQHTFTSTATEAQATAFPTASYDRMSFMSDVWDTSRNLRYAGPANIKNWQWLRHGSAAGAGGVIGFWRVIGGVLNLFPAPPAGNTIALEFITKLWITDSVGAARADVRFGADSDLLLIPERIVTLETIWRWKKRHGLDYAEDMADAERAIELDASNDRPANVIATGGGDYDFATQGNTWPGTIQT